MTSTQDHVRNAFSVDVEDYYQVLNFQSRISRDEWPRYPSRVADNTLRILDLLDRFSVKGTFFTLGLVAEQHPSLVPAIAARGHEVASHGWSHTPITRLDEASFRSELRRSRELLSSQSGQDVIGFRAPSFSVVPHTRWALDALLDEGYRYDSSMFPVKHPDYGMPNLDLRPHHHATPGERTIAELPMTVAPFLGRRVPVSGGGYFRLLPYGVTQWGLSKVNREGRAAVFYLHPWEVDPGQPNLRDKTSRLGAFRHYTNLKRTHGRLEKLLARFRFGTCAEVLEDHGLLATQSV